MKNVTKNVLNVALVVAATNYLVTVNVILASLDHSAISLVPNIPLDQTAEAIADALRSTLRNATRR